MTEMYIRFGDLPESGHSWNDELEEHEAGVSVYHAEWVTEDRSMVSIEIRSDAEYAGGWSSGMFERPVYLVCGDLLDERGGDGEPLMAPGCTAELVGPVEAIYYVIEGA